MNASMCDLGTHIMEPGTFYHMLSVFSSAIISITKSLTGTNVPQTNNSYLSVKKLFFNFIFFEHFRSLVYFGEEG